MKKIYISPELTLVRVELGQIVAQSTIGMDATGGDGTVLTKENDFEWDDEFRAELAFQTAFHNARATAVHAKCGGGVFVGNHLCTTVLAMEEVELGLLFDVFLNLGLGILCGILRYFKNFFLGKCRPAKLAFKVLSLCCKLQVRSAGWTF